MMCPRLRIGRIQFFVVYRKALKMNDPVKVCPVLPELILM